MEAETHPRRFTASEVNEMAQALDDGVGMPAQSASSDPGAASVPLTQDGAATTNDYPSAEEQTQGENPLEAEEGEANAGLYPRDVASNLSFGGSPEEQESLAEEYRNS